MSCTRLIRLAMSLVVGLVCASSARGVVLNNVRLDLDPANASTNLNYLDIKIKVNYGLGTQTKEDSTTVTGYLTTNLDVATSSDRSATVSAMGFNYSQPGTVSMTNMSYHFSVLFIFNEDVTTSGLKMATSTAGLTPVADTVFNMADHNVSLNGGTINWSGSLASGSQNCAATPINLAPTGNGTVALNRMTDVDWTHSKYQVALSAPIAFSENLDVGVPVTIYGGNGGNFAGTLSASSTAANQITAPIVPWDGYWDRSTTAGLQAGSGTWSTSSASWSGDPQGNLTNGAHTGALWSWYNPTLPDATPDWYNSMYAHFDASGTSTVTVSGKVYAYSMLITGTGYTFNSANTSAIVYLSDGVIHTDQDATVNAILDGGVYGPGGLQKNGPAKLTLGGSYSNAMGGTAGTSRLNAGTLALAKTGGALAIPGNVVIADNGTSTYLVLNGSNQIAAGAIMTFEPSAAGYGHFELLGNQQTLRGISDATGRGVIENSQAETGVGNGTLTVNTTSAGDAFSFNGYLRNTSSGSGTLALVKAGPGTLTLVGAHTGDFTGGLTVQGGTLNYSGGTLPGGSYTVTGGTLNIGALSRSIGGLQITGGAINGTGTLTSSSTFDVQGGAVNAVLAGSGGLNKTGGGSATVKSPVYTGATTVSQGTLILTGALPGGNYVVSGGTLDTSSLSKSIAGLQISAGTILGAGTLTSSSTYDVRGGSISPVLAGTVGLTKTTGNTAVLLANNTFTGTVAISDGTLQLGNNSTAGSVSGNIVNNAALVVSRSNDFTYAGVLSGSGYLRKLGAGALTLNAASGYTGATLIDQGALVLASAGQIEQSAGVTTASAGTFQVLAGVHSVSSVAGTGATQIVAGTLTTRALVQNSLTVGAGGKVVLLPVGGGAAPVPEPTTCALLATALILGRRFLRRRQATHASR